MRVRSDLTQTKRAASKQRRVREQAEATVLAVRGSWDAPGFDACVEAEMEKMRAARAISPMQVQHANEAWNAQPAEASEEDRMKAALETLGTTLGDSARFKNDYEVEQRKRLFLQAALITLAAYGDEGANKHLKDTGSYGKFDEPGAVEFARDTLGNLGEPHIERATASPSPSALTEEGVTEERAEMHTLSQGEAQ